MVLLALGLGFCGVDWAVFAVERSLLRSFGAFAAFAPPEPAFPCAPPAVPPLVWPPGPF